MQRWRSEPNNWSPTGKRNQTRNVAPIPCLDDRSKVEWFPLQQDWLGMQTWNFYQRNLRSRLNLSVSSYVTNFFGTTNSPWKTLTCCVQFDQIVLQHSVCLVHLVNFCHYLALFSGFVWRWQHLYTDIFMIVSNYGEVKPLPIATATFFAVRLSTQKKFKNVWTSSKHPFPAHNGAKKHPCYLLGMLSQRSPACRSPYT